MLAKQPAVAGAERHADRGFPGSRCGARNQQAGHIHARDHQQDADGAEHREQRAANVTHCVGLERHGLKLAAGGAVMRYRPSRSRRPLASTSCCASARLTPLAHPPHDAKKPLAARKLRQRAIEQLPRFEIVGYRGVGRHQQSKVSGHHADDGGRTAVDENAPARNRGIAAVAALPHGGAQQDRGRRPASLHPTPQTCGRLRHSRRAAEKKSVDTWPMRSCSGSVSPVSAAVVAQIAPKPSKSVDRVSRSIELGPRERRTRIAFGGLIGPDEDEPCRVRVGKRRDQQRMHHAENRRVRADAERQRDYRRERKTGGLAQHPPRI